MCIRDRRECGLGLLERHRHARLILCVDPATLLPGGDGFIHAADRLQVDTAASAHAAGLVADGSRGSETTPMVREIREVGVQGPYGTRGRRHAPLYRDVTFRHEDHSKCPANCRAVRCPYACLLYTSPSP